MTVLQLSRFIYDLSLFLCFYVSLHIWIFSCSRIIFLLSLIYFFNVRTTYSDRQCPVDPFSVRTLINLCKIVK